MKREPKEILEKVVKERVKRMLRNHSAWWHMPVQMGHGASGVDFHGCHRSRFFGIETKRPGKYPTPRQELTLEQIREAGGKTFVIGCEYDQDSDSFSGESELLAWLLNP